MFEIGMSILLVAGCCYFDLKYKRIPVALLVTAGIVSLADLIMHGVLGSLPNIFLSRIIGMIPGTLLLLLSRLTKEKIGQGDGILLIILGLFMGFDGILVILCIGLFLQSLLACFLLIIKKADIQTKIPFVPFLLAGNIMVFVYWMYF
ncbi:MAG TPA: prepilin peptidase [Lachnospiraceae bacterium]|nr:prepilin peptidase [Lachnospiraceae bacterium]